MRQDLPAKLANYKYDDIMVAISSRVRAIHNEEVQEARKRGYDRDVHLAMSRSRSIGGYPAYTPSRLRGSKRKLAMIWIIYQTIKYDLETREDCRWLQIEIQRTRSR